MRILFVTHDYLPNHPAGTEIHTAELSARLRELGVETHLFTTEKDVSRPNLRVDERDEGGMQVHELVQNLFYASFEQTWDEPAVVGPFARVLDRVQPDVVHFMHLLYLSVGCVEEVARRGIPIVFTLHDFWLSCPRFGQLIHADGSICHTVDFERCGTCLAQMKWGQTSTERRLSKLLTGLRSVSGIDLKRPARKLASKSPRRKRKKSVPAGVDPLRAEALAEAATRRDASLRERLVPAVDRFLSPSRFLRERFLAWGIPEESIEHVPNGIELGAYEGFQRTASPDGRLRIAFLGTLAPHKAPHVLLEAWGALDEELRARGRLRVYGPKHHFPAYVGELRKLAAEVGAELPGPLKREEVPAAFREIDLLVVPSTWYENMPLTLLEARATRTPVLATDLGGMRELVEDGVHGWRFPTGDSAALADHLERLLLHPEELNGLSFGEPPVRMEESARAMLERYRELLGEHS